MAQLLPTVSRKPPQLALHGHQRLWGWLLPVFGVTDEELVHSSGLDALIAVSGGGGGGVGVCMCVVGLPPARRSFFSWHASWRRVLAYPPMILCPPRLALAPPALRRCASSALGSPSSSP